MTSATLFLPPVVEARVVGEPPEGQFQAILAPPLPTLAVVAGEFLAGPSAPSVISATPFPLPVVAAPVVDKGSDGPSSGGSGAVPANLDGGDGRVSSCWTVGSFGDFSDDRSSKGNDCSNNKKKQHIIHIPHHYYN